MGLPDVVEEGKLLLWLPELGDTPFCLLCGTCPASSPLVTRSGWACNGSWATSDDSGPTGGTSGLGLGAEARGEGSN